MVCKKGWEVRDRKSEREREREREREWVRARKRERERVKVSKRERERESVCVCQMERVRDKERLREGNTEEAKRVENIRFLMKLLSSCFIVRSEFFLDDDNESSFVEDLFCITIMLFVFNVILKYLLKVTYYLYNIKILATNALTCDKARTT